MLMHTCWIQHVCSFRGSAQQAVTVNITVILTSPVPWTQKTSAVSSMTVVISSSACTYGSTSCSDWMLNPVVAPPLSHALSALRGNYSASTVVISNKYLLIIFWPGRCVVSWSVMQAIMGSVVLMMNRKPVSCCYHDNGSGFENTVI